MSIYIRVLALVALAATCTESAICVGEIEDKIKSYVHSKFNDDIGKAFDHYDPSHQGVDTPKMKKFLEDAGVSYWCRWPGKVIAEFDTNGDKKVSKEEAIAYMNKMANQARVATYGDYDGGMYYYDGYYGGDTLYEQAWENLQAAQEQFEIAKRLRGTSGQRPVPPERYAKGQKTKSGQRPARLRRYGGY